MLRRHRYYVVLCYCVILMLIIGINWIGFSLIRLIVEGDNWSPSVFISNPNEMYSYENFTKWNRSLCSLRSDQRGPHQKIFSISVYQSADNPMFMWSTSILPLLEPLAAEVNRLLPSWTIRMYVDFTGSSEAQQKSIQQFSNVDLCDIDHIPMFNETLRTFLPGKMWRFLPIFDPFVDFVLSRDLDSTLLIREKETLDFWLMDDQQSKIFYIARDNAVHGTEILGGLWGAATGRARRIIFNLFKPMLSPSIAVRYRGTGDQSFLSQYIWRHVKNRALIFDSYSCESLGGRPFLSQRPVASNCFLGCIRPCCTNITHADFIKRHKPCPIACRPKEHPDWVYC